MVLFCGVTFAAEGFSQTETVVDEPAANPKPEPKPASKEQVSADKLLEGKSIRKFDFSCDLPVCKNEVGLKAFREIAGLKVGAPFRLRTLRLAERRLAKTGFFESLSIEKQLLNDQVEVRIFAKGAVLIRKVTFEGVDAPPFESDIRKIVTFRQGQRYLPDSLKISAQLESIRSLYKKEGYFGTTIEVFVRRVEDDKHSIDLVFKIKKGKQRGVCSVGIRGIRAMTYSELKELLLSEFATLPARLNVFPTYFTTENFRKGREKIIESYRNRGHYQARIVRHETKFDPKKNCETLILDVTEGPHWDVEFSGVDRFDKEDLVKVLPFFESGYVDAQEIRGAEFAIRRLYETRGFPFTRVRGKETKISNSERSVSFKISEGPLVEIKEIRFEGNKSIKSAELLEIMATKPYGLFESGGFLQTDELLGDFGRIESLYSTRGWLLASIKNFRVDILDDGIVIVVVVDEGKQIKVEALDIVGNRMITDATLKRGLVSQKNESFVPLNLKADLAKITTKYSQLGYPMTRVTSSCRLLSGVEVPCQAPRRKTQCVARTLDQLAKSCTFDLKAQRYSCQRIVDGPACAPMGGVSERIRIRHKIEEGPRVRIGAILLRGNFDTDSKVIYREVPFEENALLDTKSVLEAQRNLRSLNIFDSVSVESIGLDEDLFLEDEGVAALVISVEESRSSQNVEFKFGLELRELLSENFQLLVTAESQYNNRNVAGSSIGFQPRLISAVDTLDLLSLGSDTAISGTSSQGVDFLVGAEIVLSHPRFLKNAFGIDKLKATLSPFYLQDLLGIINRNVLREEGGLRLELRKELIEILARFYFKLGLELKSIASFAPDGPVIDGTRIFSPRRSIGKLTFEFVLDRRDSPLNPKKGFFLRVEPSIVSGDAFGQGGEDFFTDSFLKLTLTGSVYFNFWKNFVLGQSIRVGQIFPLATRENPVQADERYFLGGIRSVRGFPDGTLGPIGSNQQPSGGEFLLNYNAEFRYPLFEKFGIYGATFFDVGLLTDCREARTGERDCFREAFANPFEQLRPTAGIGLRALILGQIPVVLDYGVVLNREAGEQFGEIHFNVGYTFD